MTAKREAGFSLLETLVMLVVVGFLVAGLAAGTSGALRVWSTETRWSRDGFEGDGTARVLRGLIVGMNGGDASAGPLPVQGGARALSFVTVLPAVPAGERTAAARVAIGVERGALVLHWTPYLPGRFGPATTRTALLAPDVASVEFSYWHKGAWQDRWSADGVPPLVRVRIVRRPGGGPEVPDLVAAPWRALPGQPS